MTKSFTILSLVILVAWGCTKKAAPTSSTAPASNSGSAVQTPATNTEKPAATTTAPVGAQATAGVGGPAGTLSAAPPKPEEAPLIAGQQTYNAKCGRCHAHKPTMDFTADRWVSIMQVMAPKANLTETEKSNVLAYVKANAKR